MSRMSDPQLRRAIADLAEIKRVLSAASKPAPSHCPALLHLGLCAAGAAASCLLFAVDYLRRPSLTGVLYLAYYSEHHRFVLVGVLSVLLAALGGALALAVWSAAQRSNEPVAEYIARNFVYLRQVSFTSDLYLKFAALCVAILAGRGDWVAPLLVLFTGDYLLQGRFFVLPHRAALFGGFGCLIIGTVQLVWLPGTLKLPLVLFFAACACSLVYGLHLRRACLRDGELGAAQ